MGDNVAQRREWIESNVDLKSPMTLKLIKRCKKILKRKE